MFLSLDNIGSPVRSWKLEILIHPGLTQCQHQCQVHRTRGNTQSGWWFQPLWICFKSMGMTIPNLWENKTCSKPPTSQMFWEKSLSSSRFLRLTIINHVSPMVLTNHYLPGSIIIKPEIFSEGYFAQS